jgi:hypothetical protein
MQQHTCIVTPNSPRVEGLKPELPEDEIPHLQGE